MDPRPDILVEILISGALIAVTMVIHGCGMHGVVRWASRFSDTERRVHRTIHVGQALAIVVLPSLGVLVADMAVWAVAFSGMGLIPDLRLAFHFAALTYTTLGASTSLPANWMLLEASCAIAGTFTFAWTTAVMFQIFSRAFAWHKI
jgi:hypothetical protein